MPRLQDSTPPGAGQKPRCETNPTRGPRPAPAGAGALLLVGEGELLGPGSGVGGAPAQALDRPHAVVDHDRGDGAQGNTREGRGPKLQGEVADGDDERHGGGVLVDRLGEVDPVLDPDLDPDQADEAVQGRKSVVQGM